MFTSPSPLKRDYSLRVTPLSTAGSVESSPVIVPSLIRVVSCNIFDHEPRPLQRQQHSREYISSAIEFLNGIATTLAPPPLTPALPSSEDEIQRALHIDLSGWTSRIAPGPLKHQINAEFAEIYPELDKSLTLSRIVNLREKLLNKLKFLGPSTLALAWSYFMVLVEQRAVVRSNRKRLVGACVLLAYKFTTEARGIAARKELKQVLRQLGGLEAADGFAKAVIRCEFQVYAQLNFRLIPAEAEYAAALAHAESRLKPVS